MPPTKTKPDPLEDLTVAILAVNSYSLEKAYALRESLRKHGWLNSQQVANLKHDEAIKALTATGYDRGPTMNSIFASRLQELGQYIAKNGIEVIAEPLRAGKKAQVDKILLAMHGVGPAVLRNFWLLQGDDNA